MGVIKLAADGSCLRQQGPGGWAYRFTYGGRIFKNSGGSSATTNNIMELEAVRQGLLSIRRKIIRDAGYELAGVRVVILTDSQYVVRGATEWIQKWKQRGWINLEGKSVANRPLWEDLDWLANQFDTRWKWIKGHNGHELNEIVDEMAHDAAIAVAKLRAW